MSGSFDTTPKIVIPDDRFNVMEPIFSQNAFDGAVDSKGYTVTIEKAIRCPCVVLGTGQGNPSCLSCGGSSWFFISKRKTVGLVQSMNKETKYQQWSETQRGTAKISLKGIDQVAFMDRVTVLEVESIFTQNAVMRRSSTNQLFAFLFYRPKEIEYIYAFTAVDSQPRLVDSTKYTVEDDHIIFDSSLSSLMNTDTLGEVYCMLGIRYKHNPTYHVIDILRETVKTFSSDDTPVILPEQNPIEDLAVKEPMPIYAVGRKVHFMFDSPNLSGESLFDNTPTNE